MSEFHTFLTILTFLLLTACQPWPWPWRACQFSQPPYATGDNAARVDRSLITGDPCQPPSWQGIIPGESTEDETMIVLEQSAFVNPDSLELLQNDYMRVVAWVSAAVPEWPPSTEPPYARHYLWLDSDNVVSVISIDLEYELGIQDLIDFVGEPDYYVIRRITLEVPCSVLELYWPQDGFMIISEPFRLARDVSPNTRVLRVDYFVPTDDLTEYWWASEYASETYVEFSLSMLREWEGLEAVNSSDR